MTKSELKEIAIANRNSELYGESILLIYYETKYSRGRYAILYAHYMTDERFRKKLEKLLSAKDMVAVERHLITIEQWLDVYALRDLPVRIDPSNSDWENIFDGNEINSKGGRTNERLQRS